MANRRVYDEPNPFAPDVRERRFIPPKSVDIPSTSSRKGRPNFERLKTRLHGMDEYSRHKQLINNYVLQRPGLQLQRDTSKDRNIYDVVQEHHRFLWDDNLTADEQKDWELKLAKKYYDKLFKEYCIADLSQYAKNRVAMRWRVEREVISGKGQFECGSKHCSNRNNLSSWEVNFSYVENDERKNALVKLRLCPDCSTKLNFHSKKRLIKKEAKEIKKTILSMKMQYKEAKKRKRSEKKEKKHKKRKAADESDSSSLDESSDTEPESESANAEGESCAEVRAEEEKAQQDQKQAEATQIWTKKAVVLEEERTINDEFDEFIDDLLF